MLCATAMLWVSTGLTRERLCSKFSVLIYIRVRSNCFSVKFVKFLVCYGEVLRIVKQWYFCDGKWSLTVISISKRTVVWINYKRLFYSIESLVWCFIYEYRWRSVVINMTYAFYLSMIFFFLYNMNLIKKGWNILSGYV